MTTLREIEPTLQKFLEKKHVELEKKGQIHIHVLPNGHSQLRLVKQAPEKK